MPVRLRLDALHRRIARVRTTAAPFGVDWLPNDQQPANRQRRINGIVRPRLAFDDHGVVNEDIDAKRMLEGWSQWTMRIDMAPQCALMVGVNAH